ncbi:hypothetical protein, partial [Nisaea nitritireducens]|uniref:hypothetical protein n=1 Tax=Nisaea nitritireducens TaxID=568392 RepID=UPI001D0031D4
MVRFLRLASAPLFSVFLLGAVSGEAKAVMLHFSPTCAPADLQHIQTEGAHTWLELNTDGPTDSLAIVRMNNSRLFGVAQGDSSCRIDLTDNSFRQRHLNGVDYCFGARAHGSNLATVRLELQTGPIPADPAPCH